MWIQSGCLTHVSVGYWLLLNRVIAGSVRLLLPEKWSWAEQTSKSSKSLHILLCHYLCMLDSWSESCNVHAFERIFKYIQDDCVRSVTDRMNILKSRAKNIRRTVPVVEIKGVNSHHLPSIAEITRYHRSENFQWRSHESVCMRVIGVWLVQLWWVSNFVGLLRYVVLTAAPPERKAPECQWSGPHNW